MPILSICRLSLLRSGLLPKGHLGSKEVTWPANRAIKEHEGRSCVAVYRVRIVFGKMKGPKGEGYEPVCRSFDPD